MTAFDRVRIAVRTVQAGLLGLALGWAATGILTAAEPTEAKPAEGAPAEAKPAEKPLVAAETSPLESITNYVNWVEFSTGGLIVDGDKAMFQQRQHIKGGPFGGIEDLHLERKLGKDTFLQLDARALFDSRDYSVRLELVRPNVGYIRGGFKEIRTWYDSTGGFLPQSATWFSLYQDPLTMDRGEAWAEIGLTLKNWPTITLKYTYQFRDGVKDSTSWGDTHLTGGLGTRAIIPSLREIDERRHIVDADVKHTIGKTDFGVGLRYEANDNNKALKVRQWPGEPTDTHLTDRERYQADIFNVHAFTETHLNEKIYFSSGYSFTTLDSDLSGSRVYGADFDVAYQPGLINPLGFYALAGGSQMKEYVMNLNLMYTPWPNFSIVPSVRLEKQDIDSAVAFTPTDFGAEGAQTAVSARGLLDVAERLEARYTGLTNWVLYARGDWTEGEGDLREAGGATPALGLPGILRYTQDTRFIQRYTAGANWYPLRRLNVDFQYYHKIRRNHYDHLVDSTPNDSVPAYPAFFDTQGFDTDDFNVRLTLRPADKITLVTRYDFQLSTVDTAPAAPSPLVQVQSSQLTSHMVGQSITWVPWYRLYMQAGLNYVLSTTDTPADDYTQAVLDAKNNYWTASFTSGLILSKKTDLQLHYFYYHSDNYVDNSAYGVPYGAGAEEHGVTVTLLHRITDHMRLTLKYGFFTYRDDLSGGHNNYHAHLVYSGLQYMF